MDRERRIPPFVGDTLDVLRETAEDDDGLSKDKAKAVLVADDRFTERDPNTFSRCSRIMATFTSLTTSLHHPDRRLIVGGNGVARKTDYPHIERLILSLRRLEQSEHLPSKQVIDSLVGISDCGSWTFLRYWRR